MVSQESEYQRRIIARQAERHDPVQKECTFQPTDLKRWELVSRAWQKYRTATVEHDPFSKKTSGTPLYNGIGTRIGNWPRSAPAFLDKFVVKLGIRLPIFSIAAGLYGALHLLAWEAPFGSRAEQFSWRASGLFLVLSGPSLLCVYPVVLVVNLWQSLQDKDVEARGWPAFKFWLLCFSSFFGLFLPFSTILVLEFIGVYIPARVFLIVESRVQLARLPPGAYTTPDWSKYYPHIS